MVYRLSISPLIALIAPFMMPASNSKSLLGHLVSQSSTAITVRPTTSFFFVVSLGQTLTFVHALLLLLLIDTTHESWCDEVDTSVPSERIVITNENKPSDPNDSQDYTESSNSDEDNDEEEDEDDDSDNSVGGTTCSVLSAFIVLIATVLVT